MTKHVKKIVSIGGRVTSTHVLAGVILALVAVSVLVVLVTIRVGGIEASNRSIICQSRELREQYPPETALEKAQLENTRRNASDCK